MLLVWAGLTACRATGHPGDRTLDADEIHALFGDHTVVGHHQLHGYDFRSYYDADGGFRSHQSDKTAARPARWWCQDQRLCVRWQDTQQQWYRLVVEHDGEYRKVDADEPTRTIVTFQRFIAGNPDGL